MNAGSKYDLVLMDIIMPNLDGVSACHLIRQFDHTPIIAMTSNIRSDDISMYFQHGRFSVVVVVEGCANIRAGMNDVLPKPFTKEGLLSMLEKHLGHLKHLSDGGMEPMGPQPGIAHASVASSLKDETSPAASPSAISSWPSSGPFHGISPTQASSTQSFMQPMHSGGYSEAPSPMSYQPPHTPLGGPPQMQHRRQISELGPEDISNDTKRQRLYEQNMQMNQMQPGRTR